MVYQIEVDMDGSDDYMATLERWINQGLRVTEYHHTGPGGGNPSFTFETNNLSLVEEFLEFYNPDEDLEDLFELHVREI